MNKIYRAIWNESTQTWVAASELAKSKTKANAVSSDTAKPSLLARMGLCTFRLGLLASLINMSLYSADAVAATGSDRTAIWGGGINKAGDTFDKKTSFSAVTIAGDNNDFCGYDYIKGFSAPAKPGKKDTVLTQLDEYLRFAQNTSFKRGTDLYTPYGSTNQAEEWSDQWTHIIGGKGSKGTAGYQSQRTGGGKTLIATAYGTASFSYGCASLATGNYSLAFGTNSQATAGGAQAFGVAAVASGRASNAIGISSEATGVSGVALGSVAQSDGVGSVALGLQARANADGAVGVGVGAHAGLDSSVAIGNDNILAGKQSIGIGSGNAVDGEQSIAIGSAQTPTTYNTVDGTQKNVTTHYTYIKGNKTLSLGNSNTGQKIKKEDSEEQKEYEWESISAANTAIFGNNNVINNAVDGAHIIGSDNTVGTSEGIAGTGATVIGNHASISADNALALGNQTTVSGADAMAIGTGAVATVSGGVALGSGSLANTAQDAAGYNPNNHATYSDPVSTAAWKSTNGAVAVGNTDPKQNITRQITDVAAGTEDTDAVNVAQLKNLGFSVPGIFSSASTSIDTNLIAADQTIISSSAAIPAKFDSFNSSISTISSQIKQKFGDQNTSGEVGENISRLSTSLADNITSIQKKLLLDQGGFYDTKIYDGKTPRKIIHVADADISNAGSTDLVNGRLLYATNSSLSSLSSSIDSGLSTLNSGATEAKNIVDTSTSQINTSIDSYSTSVSTGIHNLQTGILKWNGLPEGEFRADNDNTDHKITGVAEGSLAADSTDAVTGGQLHATNTNISSLSNSVSTSFSSLSSSLYESSGLEKLSTSLSDTGNQVAALQNDALQWDDIHKVYRARHGDNDENQKITHVSAGVVDFASTDAVTGGQYYDLNTEIDTSVSTLTASALRSVGQINSNISALQQQVLQLDGKSFNAQRDGKNQAITGVAGADLTDSSVDAVTGAQLYSTNTSLNNLTASTATGLSSLSTQLSRYSENTLQSGMELVNGSNTSLSALQSNALLWNSEDKAYSAAHGTQGNQNITNIAAGEVKENSTDLINMGQIHVFSVSASTSIAAVNQAINSLNGLSDTEINRLADTISSSLSTAGNQIAGLKKNLLLWNGNAYDASHGNPDGTGKITHVAEGSLLSDSTDAVTGGQLYRTNTRISDLKAESDNQFNIYSGKIDSSLATAQTSLSNSIATDINSVHGNMDSGVQTANSHIATLQQDSLLWNGKAYDASHNQGDNGKNKITNVAKGDILHDTSSDAVTGAQLFATNSSIDSLSTAFDSNASKFISTTDSNLSSLSAAMQNSSFPGLESLSTGTQSRLGEINNQISGLQQALQWNDGAYDASFGKNGMQKITHVADGRLEEGSKDAVTGNQLYNTDAAISNLGASLSTGINNISSSIQSIAQKNDETITDLSEKVQQTKSQLTSLETTTAADLTHINTSISALQDDAVQWDGKNYVASHRGKPGVITHVLAGSLNEGSSDAVIGAQLYSTNSSITDLGNKLTDVSNSFSTGISSLSTALSGNADSKLSQLVQNRENIENNITHLSSSVSSAFISADNEIAILNQNALQWNSSLSAFDASHGQKDEKHLIKNAAEGDLHAGSADAITAGQLYTTNSTFNALDDNISGRFSSLSTTLSSLINTNVSTLSSSIAGLDTRVSGLEQNALQWNSDIAAYDASRATKNPAKITNVAAGLIASDSSDAVIGAQLHSLSTVSDGHLSAWRSSILSSLSTIEDSATTASGSLSQQFDTLSENISNNLQEFSGSVSSGVSSSFVSTSEIVTGLSSAIHEHLSQLSDGIGESLTSLSTSTDTGINTLSSRIDSSASILTESLNTVNNHISTLNQDALQWNGGISAYDASHGSGSAQRITHVAAGNVSADSTDAINGGQFFALSSSASTGLNSLSTSMSSMADIQQGSISTIIADNLKEVNQNVSSLSTGLNTANSDIGSLSSGYVNINKQVSSLSQDALQWNSGISAYDASHGSGSAQKIIHVAAGNVSEESTDAINGGQFFALSSSASTGLNSLSTSMSNMADIQQGSISTIIADNLKEVNQNVSSLSTGLNTANSDIGSLSSGYVNINKQVSSLNQDALQWNSGISAYDASHGSGSAQRITHVAAGDVSAHSTDAINGGQFFALSSSASTGLSSLSTSMSSMADIQQGSISTIIADNLKEVNQNVSSLSTGLNTANSDIGSLSSGYVNINKQVSSLSQDALQWNSGISAYDASHGSGSAQKITHVAAGNVSAESTDAINGGQFFALSSSASTGLNSLSTTVSSAVTSQINSIGSSLFSNYQTLSSAVSSLSTASSSMKSTMTYLNENALKWTGDGFDAGHSGKTRGSNSPGKIMNLADGDVTEDSHDAINGGQLYRAKSDVTEYGIRWISDGIDNEGHETGAYYATRDGVAQKITGIAAGDLNESSLDAVNGGQLRKVKDTIDTLTKDLSKLSSTVSGLPSGTISNDPALTSLSTAISSQISSVTSYLGTASQPGTNSIKQPKYDITTPSGSIVSANNVKDALENLENYGTKYAKSNSAKAASVAQGVDSVAIGGASMASGTSAVAIGDSASASSANGVALGSQAKVTQSGGVALGSGSVANTAAGKEGYIPVTATQQQAEAIRATKSTEGAVSVGDASKGVYRQITGVAAGTADTDAVNVAQLKGVNNQVSMINEYVNQLNDNIHHVERRAYSGTALAMALSGAYLPSLNGGEQTVGVGVGAYRGYGAVGLNYKAASKNGKVTWGAGVSTTGKETAVNSVLGFKW
ncbi:ESPR-type extended signal peptide-containing protein [Snodgrassella alvi]|uniref:ESPR-type extended signal peptide-containing protein n=1 Tax=Snodgrassella alvi TaxID=1196083 RepID=UPI00351C539B